MTTHTDNPYPSLKIEPEKLLANNKNTLLRGFFIGWCIIIVSLTLLVSSFWSLKEMIQETFHPGRDMMVWIFAITPISLFGTMIWLTVKRHYKSALGIAIALVSMAAFSALAVTAVFALF